MYFVAPDRDEPESVGEGTERLHGRPVVELHAGGRLVEVEDVDSEVVAPRDHRVLRARQHRDCLHQILMQVGVTPHDLLRGEVQHPDFLLSFNYQVVGRDDQRVLPEGEVADAFLGHLHSPELDPFAGLDQLHPPTGLAHRHQLAVRPPLDAPGLRLELAVRSGGAVLNEVHLLARAHCERVVQQRHLLHRRGVAVEVRALQLLEIVLVSDHGAAPFLGPQRLRRQRLKISNRIRV